MTSVVAAIRAWDCEVIATYRAKQAQDGRPPEARLCLTLQPTCARQLDTTLRSLAPSPAFSHSCAFAARDIPEELRAAGIEVAIASAELRVA